jgi:hypothetical protein
VNPLHAAVENFVYTSAGDFPDVERLIQRADIAGVQVVYNWNLLEPEKNKYDFSEVDQQLSFVTSLHKKMFVQIQDRFFSPDAKNVPRYLLRDPEYQGGLVSQIDNPGEGRKPVSGWVAEQWNPNVRQRFQDLLRALARRFDGAVYGVNLPETAIDIDMKRDKTGFTCDGYFEAEEENAAFARKVFRKSYVVQYVNFWPCEWNNDHNYMGRFFDFAAKSNVGLGGPDIVPYGRAQMSNSYPFFAKYKNRLNVVAMAVQEPTLTYKNPKTGKRFTREEFEKFATGYLGATMIFWSASTPWLR